MNRYQTLRKLITSKQRPYNALNKHRDETGHSVQNDDDRPTPGGSSTSEELLQPLHEQVGSADGQG